MASRSDSKTTRRTASKEAASKAAPPLTEAAERILKAVDVTRMLHEHQDAKLIGRRNRDMGFAILLVHLDKAYKALWRHSNGPTGKAQSAAFNTAHAAMTKALGRYDAIKSGSRGKSERAFDRLVDTRQGAIAAANRKLVAATARDVCQLAGKIDALWRLYVSDVRKEADAPRFAEFGEREFALLKSIRRDAAHLTTGGRS